MMFMECSKKFSLSLFFSSVYQTSSRILIVIKKSFVLVIFDDFLAIFDAKHIYDPANPFARDDKIAKAHSLNPAFVQFMQEEQKVEVSFLHK